MTESLTNPIRIAIGWYAVAPAFPPALLLATVWTFGAFLMTGKRLAEPGSSGISPHAIGQRSARTRWLACSSPSWATRWRGSRR